MRSIQLLSKYLNLNMPKAPITPPALSDDFNAIINNAQRQIDIETESSKKPTDKSSWQHFSFICDKTIVYQIHCIARREGFSIRQLLECILSRAIESFIEKTGEIKDREKRVDDIL